MPSKKVTKTRRKSVEDHAPYLPAAYTPGDVLSIQRLAAGTATEEEQKMAFKWIIEKAAGTHNLTYHPNSERDSDFAQGRRFAGLQIVKLLYINYMAMEDNK